MRLNRVDMTFLLPLSPFCLWLVALYLGPLPDLSWVGYSTGVWVTMTPRATLVWLSKITWIRDPRMELFFRQSSCLDKISEATYMDIHQEVVSLPIESKVELARFSLQSAFGMQGIFNHPQISVRNRHAEQKFATKVISSQTSLTFATKMSYPKRQGMPSTSSMKHNAHAFAFASVAVV